MSLINTMLQDLDRRQALGTEADVAAVRTPSGKPRREWFWYTLAVLMMLSVAWVGWTAFQLTPRPLVTPLALSAAEEARARPKPRPAAEAPPPAIEPASKAAPQPDPAPSPAAFFETMRLAMALQAPVREPPLATPRPPRPEVIKPAAPRAPAKGTVNKHERAAPDSTGSAANGFRRAVTLVSQGRVAEAQQLLAVILKAEPAHANARQVYVAVLLEQGRVAHARRLLEEGLALEPSHAEFALALARIHTAQREYEAALEVMNKVAPAASADSDFQTLRGAVLQRLGRHAEAVEAYQSALRGAPQQATSWLGLAISYETLGRATEAGDAYRRALGAGPLAPAARQYAETRALALQ